MLGITPYISFKGDCAAAIEFYKTALDAEVRFSQTYDGSPMAGMGEASHIMHCTIRVGGSEIMMCDDPNPAGVAAASNISLSVGVGDVAQANRYFGNLSDGGNVIMPLQKTFWAEAFGMVTDKFGVKWMVNCDGAEAR